MAAKNTPARGGAPNAQDAGSSAAPVSAGGRWMQGPALRALELAALSLACSAAAPPGAAPPSAKTRWVVLSSRLHRHRPCQANVQDSRPGKAGRCAAASANWNWRQAKRRGGGPARWCHEIIDLTWCRLAARR
ncbi:hypothetical protein ACU4GD_25100 [Cupriavidus basilensis]